MHNEETKILQQYHIQNINVHSTVYDVPFANKIIPD